VSKNGARCPVLSIMKNFYVILKHARKRLLQNKLHLLSHVELLQEIQIFLAFIYGAGISNEYDKFRDAALQIKNDLEILNGMEEERNE